MKLSSLLVLLTLNVGALAGPARADDTPAKLPPAATDKAWSVAGPWYFMHSHWAGPLTLAPDGTLLGGGDRLQGRWLLTAEQDQVHLIIRWRDWASVDLAMLNANEFYGKDGQSELRLRRQPPAPIATGDREPGGAVEFRSWHQGEPPVKLLRADEGFCALTSVTGHFAGSGEVVKVYVAEDGYWYLAGTSMQDDVAAGCIVIRYRKVSGPRVDLSGAEEVVTPLHK